MSLSKSKRLDNIHEALRGVLIYLGNKAISTWIDPNDEPLRGILPATWADLVDAGFMAKHLTPEPCYEMNGFGYWTALKLSGHLESPEFKSRLGQLCGAFKDQVKGRGAEKFVAPSFASEAGLSPQWVSNVVDANLIEHCFNQQGVRWHRRPLLIKVPINFGLDLYTPQQ